MNSWAAALLPLLLAAAHAHPLCLDSSFPYDAATIGDDDLCYMYRNEGGTCCPGTDNDGLLGAYWESIPFDSTECQEKHRELVCGRCHPWSQHLWEGFGDRMNLCSRWCAEYRDACQLGGDYCDFNSLSSPSGGDEYYCYPFDPEANVAADSSAFEEAFGENYLLELAVVSIVYRPDTDWPWLVDQRGSIVEVQGKTGDLYPPSATIIEIGELPDVYPLGGAATQTEMGLLGLAFHPTFGSEGGPSYFFVYYFTYAPGYAATRLSRMTYRDGKGVDELVILEIFQDYENHQGGWLSFPPWDLSGEADTFTLYLSTGDGGGAFDPSGNSQRDGSLKGKILTFQVTRAGDISEPYQLAKGLRNPWRCSFAEDGRLFCADVGQDKMEWISEVTEGANLGWPCYEGNFRANSCEVENHTWPIYAYCHWDGCAAATGRSVTGGHFYRGKKYADVMGGMYVFADYMSYTFWGLRLDAGKASVEQDEWIASKGGEYRAITTFGEDAEGELIFAVQGWDLTSKIFKMPCGSPCEINRKRQVEDQPEAVTSLGQQVCAAPGSQCGGSMWNGPTCCGSGTVCHVWDSMYSQCVEECALLWQQCGGLGYEGPSRCCDPGSDCIFLDGGFSQCQACAGKWEQCGGMFWDGLTCCQPDAACTVVDEYFSHCRPTQFEPALMCSAAWEQCTGDGCCEPGTWCTARNANFMQCVPAA
jgi:glucose/arabinose dehydrogenase